MHKRFRHSVIFFVTIALVFVSLNTGVLAQNQAEGGDVEAGTMTFDLLLVRPFSALATLLGSAAFVVSLPFTAVGGSIEPAYEKMVKAPAAYTFTRPLGSF